MHFSSLARRIFASIVLVIMLIMTVLGSFSFASAATITPDLFAVYSDRPDLQAVFDEQGNRRPNAKITVKTLDEWAMKYGYKEYKELLIEYAPKSSSSSTPINTSSDSLFKINTTALRPVSDGVTLPLSLVSAKAIFVLDVPSNRIIYSHNADQVWPIASLTKLMSVMVSLDTKLSMDTKFHLLQSDEVGGARLRVTTGDKYAIRDLLYATLVGSANNAANAISRASGLSHTAFISSMNAKAKSFGLLNTTFVDPTGIEPANISTAKEVAAMATQAFAYEDIRRMTTTAKYSIATADSTHIIKNTNGLLTDEKNGIYVLGGKTGYLPESGWNLAVKMKDHRNRPILVVVLGTDSQKNSFKDAETVGKFIWGHTKWVK